MRGIIGIAIVTLIGCKESKPQTQHDPAPAPAPTPPSPATPPVPTIDAAGPTATPPSDAGISFDGRWTIALGYDGGDCDDKPSEKRLVFDLADQTKATLVEPTGSGWTISVQLGSSGDAGRRDVAIHKDYDARGWRFVIAPKGPGFSVDGGYAEKVSDDKECSLVLAATPTHTKK